ncbi:Rad21 / Rec8 like protein [Trichuris suis]|nr:Rad21 / Rec8 like protein [Trichuris suis]
MFYSWNILARKDGKFSVIWLAATRERKLSKKQCESVNLCNSCSELCKHIPSPDRVKSVERFSLYLCSQLMFGIVVIFNRKHEYLLRKWKTFIYNLPFHTKDSRFPDVRVGSQISLRKQLVQREDNCTRLILNATFSYPTLNKLVVYVKKHGNFRFIYPYVL